MFKWLKRLFCRDQAKRMDHGLPKVKNYPPVPPYRTKEDNNKVVMSRRSAPSYHTSKTSDSDGIELLHPVNPLNPAYLVSQRSSSVDSVAISTPDTSRCAQESVSSPSYSTDSSSTCSDTSSSTSCCD